jgi:16S rRNA (guanine527-N7)-methyltransferase
LSALGIELDDHARSAIDAHARLLVAWNRAINLTAITEPARIALAHVVDSLTAVRLVQPSSGHTRLLDLGSGPGYPGIPLATAVPEADVTLVESIAKKARFLAAAVGVAKLGGRVSVAAVRGESLASRVDSGELAPFDVVTARAVGSLPDLVRIAFPLLGAGGRLIAWKRGDIDAEVAAATRAAIPFGGGSTTIRQTAVVGLEGHVLVVVERLAR